MAHKDIRIPFTVDGCQYEAVGFLGADEPYVRENEMLSRTMAEGHLPLNGDEGALFDRNPDKLPAALRPYCLIGFHRDGCVSCFSFSRESVEQTPSWKWFRDVLEGLWDEHYLVLRRCR